MKAARATSDAGAPGAQRTIAAGPPREKLRPSDPASLMRRTRSAIRRELWPVAGFSLAINLLALVSSIYLMELFDRVLTSGSYGTLLWLTVLAIGATAVFGFLGSVRRRILIRIGDWLERELGAPAIDATMSLRLAGGGRDGAAATRALADIKAFIANEGVVAFLDAPWAPVFILAIAALHPLLGLYALAAALLLVLLALLNEGLIPAFLTPDGRARSHHRPTEGAASVRTSTGRYQAYFGRNSSTRLEIRAG